MDQHARAIGPTLVCSLTPLQKNNHDPVKGLREFPRRPLVKRPRGTDVPESNSHDMASRRAEVGIIPKIWCAVRPPQKDVVQIIK